MYATHAGKVFRLGHFLASELLLKLVSKDDVEDPFGFTPLLYLVRQFLHVVLGRVYFHLTFQESKLCITLPNRSRGFSYHLILMYVLLCQVLVVLELSVNVRSFRSGLCHTHHL